MSKDKNKDKLSAICQVNDNLLMGVNHTLGFFYELLTQIEILEAVSDANEKKNIATFVSRITPIKNLLEKEQQELMDISSEIKLGKSGASYKINEIYAGMTYLSMRSKILAAIINFISKLTPKALKPSLGKLNQYAPKKLIIPGSYRSNCRLTKSTPLVAIVTPSYNQGAYIKRTIDSVLDQGYPNLEYIVQDGNSTDQTVEILHGYEKALCWESKKDHGQGNAINLGFKKTSGEIMAYLNSDDLLLPGTLNYVVDYFNLHPEVDVVYGHRIIIDENDCEIGRWILPPHNNEILSWADYIPQETLFWRRRIWDKVDGTIDESFQFALDWDLLIRFRNAGAKFHRLPRFLGAFRVHQNQKTSSKINTAGLKEMMIIRQRCRGKYVTHGEILMQTVTYLGKSIFYMILSKMGLLQY